MPGPYDYYRGLSLNALSIVWLICLSALYDTDSLSSLSFFTRVLKFSSPMRWYKVLFVTSSFKFVFYIRRSFFTYSSISGVYLWRLSISLSTLSYFEWFWYAFSIETKKSIKNCPIIVIWQFMMKNIYTPERYTSIP